MDEKKDKSSDPVENPESHHVDIAGGRMLGQKGVWEASTDDAQTATLNEHSMTLYQALRAQPWAVLWSIVVSMSIVMEGYDTILIGNFYAYPTFKEKYGEYYPDAGYQLSGAWQVGLMNGSAAGMVIGAFLNGYLVTKFGFRKVLMGAFAWMTASVFATFFAPNASVLTAGQVLCGLSWGVFATIGPAYASEICPLAFRVYLTAYTNMCFAMGQFIAAGVMQSLVARTDQWSYRIPFAIQWIWPVPLFFVAWFVPESPWWLVRHRRWAEAENSVKRLCSKECPTTPKQVVAMMIHTDELEQEIKSGSSYWDCFTAVDRRRTEIACVVFAGQILSGSQFAYNGTYFFEQAGMSTSDSYKLNLGGTAIAFVGTIISWYLMSQFGRRTIYVTGMGTMATILAIIGFLDLAPHSDSVKWAQSALTVIWLFTFSLSVGPTGWAIPAEVSATRLRSKTISLARNTYYISMILANVIEPYMINPTEWNWKGKTGFFWFGTALLTFTWAFFRLPETKGRTFEELDILFADRVPTRKFKKHVVDAYGNQEE